MDYTLTNYYWTNKKEILLENMMGPNAFRLTEELTNFLNINSNMRILDLGCGRGLSSILLAKKYGSIVFASDLWISPTDNKNFFIANGLDDKIIPIYVDITKGLPFAEEYFDLIICIGAYHYFGVSEKMLSFLISFIKRGGYIAVAMPGLQNEGSMSTELSNFFPDNPNFHSVSWWKNLWNKTTNIMLENCRQMSSHTKAWNEWLQSSNPYAIEDKSMMEIESGKYFNHIQLIAKRL